METYTKPVMEIIEFECEDVITTSGNSVELDILPPSNNG